MDSVLLSLIVIVVFGVGAQWLAWRLRLPSIMVLLFMGFLAGPVFGLLNPDQLFQDLLFPLVSISVAIILFEGGLGLKLRDLTQSAATVRNLVTVGVLITWVLSTLGARYILGFELQMALLLGAVLVVTGPTVILPLLRYLRLSGKVGSILKWEAMVNDLVGAILSILVFEAILVGGAHNPTGHAFVSLVKTLFFGIATGGLFAWLWVFLLKRYLIPDFLQSAATFMGVLAVFALSNYLQEESGLLAVTIVGFVLANQKQIALKDIVDFKENLRVLLISSIFIILAARLEMRLLAHIGIPAILFLLFLIFVVRPVMVLASTVKSNLKFKEKMFIAWMAPRGIVAAAVASIFALGLERHGFPVEQTEKFIAVTFFIIISTVVIYGMSAPWFAKAAKIAQPNPQGALILGAHSLAQKIAVALKEEGLKTVLVDTNWFNVSTARTAGLVAERGSILSESFLDDIDFDGIGRFIALTSNDEVNSLACVQCAEIFGRSETYQLPIASKKMKASGEVQSALRGRFLFGKDMNFETLNLLSRREGVVKKIPLNDKFGMSSFQKEYAGKAVILFVLTGEKNLKPYTAENPPQPQAGQSLIVLSYEPARAKISEEPPGGQKPAG